MNIIHLFLAGVHKTTEELEEILESGSLRTFTVRSSREFSVIE